MTLVFVNGCFDCLHGGHVHFLRQARALGDRLVVGVNDDAGVRRLKGPGRPVQTLVRRLAALLALSEVAAVYAFAEDDPCELVRRLRPEVLAKSAEYAPGGKTCPEAALVQEWKGLVIYLPRLPGLSTTELLDVSTTSGRGP